MAWRLRAVFGAGAGVCAASYVAPVDAKTKAKEWLTNFSETYKTETVVQRPENVEEVQRLVAKGNKLRVVGSGLSPNGVAFPEDDDTDAVSLAHMDGVVSFNEAKQTVTVEAGCTVRKVMEYLSERDMTLENFSSIMDQELAGWTQVAAHGTGVRIPTVDEMIVSLTLQTPKGELRLSQESNPLWFSVAKVCCGTLGIVTQLELQCKRKCFLKEEILVENRDIAAQRHQKRLRNHRHLKYLYVPTEDKVVVVTADPVDAAEATPAKPADLSSLSCLLGKELPGASFSGYRDELLKKKTTDREHVMAVNKAEAEYWEKNAGQRVEDSSDVLGFDCGGHQWVYEVCIPSGTLEAPNGNDMKFLDGLLKVIKEKKIAAPNPIEVRYTAGSSSVLSPAYSKEKSAYFTWIGIIMYLPPGSDRAAITSAFTDYRDATSDLQTLYNAVPHWAKVDPTDAATLTRMQRYYQPSLHTYHQVKAELDPLNQFPWSVLDTLRSTR